MNFFKGAGNLSSFRVFAFILLTVIALHYLDFISINIGPFSTRGAIYVDSPEIYTRERLVNDRYDQDFWLREQLRKLDDTQNLVTAKIDEQVSVGRAVDTSADSPQEGLPPLPFDQDFRIRTAIRDTIRQLMLENMLDDRHDLTGNSVYGLKFDTTVIPGSNTRERAFVRVNLVVKDPFKIDQNNLERPPDGVDEKELAFYATPDTPASSPSSALYDAHRLYRVWLASIGDRLNTYMAKKIRSDDFMAQCKNTKGDKTKMDQLIEGEIRQNIELVLGTAGKSNQVKITAEFPGYKVDLPKPWRKFMSLYYNATTEGSGCNVPVNFDVEEKKDSVYVFEKGKKPDSKKYYVFASTPMERQLASTLSQEGKTGGDWHPASYPPSGAGIDLRCTKNLKWCAAKGEDRGVWVPSGLFNFIDSIGTRDIYSYAVFPKNEVEGILSSSSVDVALSEGAPGPSWFGFVRGLRESQIESVLVGFGDGSRGYKEDRDKPDEKAAGEDGVHQEDGDEPDEKGKGRDGVEFGWVMSSRGKMGPTQKTQLALISVPGWTTELTLKVTTGWLDRNANEEVEKQFVMEVPVPPDYESFDGLLAEVQLQRNPKISDSLMDANLKVSACEDAKILIPGSRLWRSATVTLGSQKADRITVLPNMEGIIAEFAPVEIPPVSVEGKAPTVKLRVWTSEGADTAENGVEIQPPRNSNACPK